MSRDGWHATIAAVNARKLIPIAALLASFAAASPAAGAVGQLTYDGCLGDTGAQGCIDLPKEPIGAVGDVALSPDGRSVYVTGHNGDSISHFFRDPATGQLAFDGCLNNDGSQNCGDLPNAPLNGAAGVAVSPDGRSVYVTAHFGSAVLHFFREPAGQLFYDGCLANDATNGCVELQGAPLQGAAGVAVSPDSASVYVAGGDAVVMFAANGPAGQIVYAGCLNSHGLSYCVDVPGAPLANASDIAVSPDGRVVYVSFWDSDAVGYVFRNRTASSTGSAA